MTDFGTYLFVSILALAIGLVIQYYLIKAAVLSALKENAQATKTDQTVKKLLEIIAKGAGDKEEAVAYFKEKRKQEYIAQRKHIEQYTYNEKERLEKLNADFADILTEEK